MSLDFILRPYTPSDRAFVVDSWVSTLRAATEETRFSDRDAFREYHWKRIDGLLDDKRMAIRVAAPPDDDVTIYGYLAEFSPDMLHMLFVKKPFRRQGVAKRLLEGHNLQSAVFTQWSLAVPKWILPKLLRPDGTKDRHGNAHYQKGIRYNPWAI